jgi:hypothetical protein
MITSEYTMFLEKKAQKERAKSVCDADMFNITYV